MTHFNSVREVDAEDLPDGCCSTIFIYPVAEWLADFHSSLPAFCPRSYRIAADLFHSVSLVLPGGLRGSAGGAHVFCNRGIPSLFFAPRVQDQPRVPVCHRVHGHVFFAEGRAVVGGASPAPSPLLRPGTGSPFADALRLFLVA